MGRIFYLMGKSSTGKDSLYKQLKEDLSLGLKNIVLYTTRPIRAEEEDGKHLPLIYLCNFIGQIPCYHILTNQGGDFNDSVNGNFCDFLSSSLCNC